MQQEVATTQCTFCLEEIEEQEVTCVAHKEAVGSVYIEPLSSFEILKAEFIPRDRASLSWTEKDEVISENNPLMYTCYVCKNVSSGFEPAHKAGCKRALLLNLGYYR